MPRRTAHLRVAVVGAALCAALLGGCSSVVAGTPAADPRPAPTAGPGSDPVAWADKICGSLLTFVRPALAQPNFTGAADLAAIKTLLSDYLGSIVTGIEQGRSQLQAAGASPVTGGDDARTKIDALLTKLQTDMTSAKAKVDAADPNNPAAFQTALQDAEKALGEINTTDGLGDINASPRLNKAAEQAKSCQDLKAQVGQR